MKVVIASVLLLAVFTTANGGKIRSTKLTNDMPLSSYTGATPNIELLFTKPSEYAEQFEDPLWYKQWYMQEYRTQNGPVMDHDVVDVYKSGTTGNGVFVAVLGEGVQHGHRDLDDPDNENDNFLEEESYDYCQGKEGSDTTKSTNATKAAGVIAMKANKLCGVGVAYHASIIGVTVSCDGVDGVSASRDAESKGLVHMVEDVDIYSNTWGPKDDGATMEEIGEEIENAIYRGITEGREHRGSLYLFDAGDGKALGDNCAADDIVNNVTTITIAGATQRGKIAWYSEKCPGIMATAYSGGDDVDGDGKVDGVVSIDKDNTCTDSFIGTTAATPIAAGILSLVLEANDKLYYRDIMHLIAYTSEVAPLADNPDTWKKNAKGFFVSNDFGFGLLNGENIVTLAKTFPFVPAARTCSVTVKLPEPKTLKVGQDVEIEIDTKSCQNHENDVNFLEQIELVSSIEFPDRGDIEVDIKSPQGTYTDLLDPRINDASTEGLNHWSIKSVHTWGEDPEGKWTVIVKATDLDGNSASAQGLVKEFTLKLHGTGTAPEHYSTPRKYQTFRLPNGVTSE